MLNITNRNLTVRLNIKRHRFFAFTLYVRKISLSGYFAEHVIETPHTSLASTQPTEIERTISISKAKILVYSIEITFFTCKRNHIRRIKTIIFIVHIKLMNTALVCMSCYTVVRNTDCYPYSSLHSWSFSNHFHNPSLIRIGNSK